MCISGMRAHFVTISWAFAVQGAGSSLRGQGRQTYGFPSGRCCDYAREMECQDREEKQRHSERGFGRISFGTCHHAPDKMLLTGSCISARSPTLVESGGIFRKL